MDIIESIEKRKSIRAFKPDPVPQSILKELMEHALRAPSWGNTQPWDIIIAAGSKLEAIKQGFTEKAGQEVVADIARPQDFPEPYASRRRPPGAPPQAAPAGQQPPVRRPMNTRFYNAPCVIYICTGRTFYFQPKGINAWPVYDCGLISENIMLLAPAYGLGTAALAQAVTHPDVLRRVLEIPDSLLVVLGIAIGYPDWDDPATHRRSAREPMAQVVKWVGF
ncbi:MAG: nitroreductase [Chloroflexi bacterium]|nr:nitroreductase [Chloroflexota bacterium]